MRWMTSTAMLLMLGRGVLGQEVSSTDYHLPTLRVLSWNIQYGRDEGTNTNNWPRRKQALRHALEEARPSIFCAQEALPGQVGFLSKVLESHGYVATGRDDGKRRGESCAIFYDTGRFELLDSGTFWLSDTPHRPSRSEDWGDRHHRICTWVKLKDEATGQSLRVLNTHFPLTRTGRRNAADLIMKHVKELPRHEPVIYTGDFNCGPGSEPWRLFQNAGFMPAELLAGLTSANTYRIGGLGIACLDGIFLRGAWTVEDHQVVRDRHRRTYPSDHFGLLSVIKPLPVAKPRPAIAAEDGEPFVQPASHATQ